MAREPGLISQYVAACNLAGQVSVIAPIRVPAQMSSWHR